MVGQLEDYIVKRKKPEGVVHMFNPDTGERIG